MCTGCLLITVSSNIFCTHQGTADTHHDPQMFEFDPLAQGTAPCTGTVDCDPQHPLAASSVADVLHYQHFGVIQDQHLALSVIEILLLQDLAGPLLQKQANENIQIKKLELP